ncbi:hypothetical protein [Paenibacillus sp. N3.4]|uniref:hypothetical protein n=1 Tax=Paenibacillus sp. N3.4 TaxID=2603222 RepID=UPI0011CBEECD|nr:hypothetical protein [Paenibacillus sp. N3.4]TXK85409.1 hypothetical protein FU659_03910 [Paenibacillus sp. N3.4]
MGKFMYSEKGAVSVYLILIIVPIFLFQAVLIDFARIKFAEKETESAVKAATRSVLSAYDNELQAMGLYGLGISQDKAKDIFRDVFGNNLSAHVSAGGFHYVDTKALNESIRLTPVYSLASHVVFQQQILEDMKIKAPIEYTLELTDKFRKSGTNVPFQQGSQFSKEGAELEKLLEQREGALDEAWSYSEELHLKISTYHSYYQARITELDRLASEIGIHTIEEVRSQLTAVKDQLKSIHESLKNLDMTLAALSQAGPEAAASMQSIFASKQVMNEQAQALVQKQNEFERLLTLIIQYAALIAETKVEVPLNQKTVQKLQQTIESSLRIAKQKNEEIRIKLNGIHTSMTNSAPEVYEVFQSVNVIGDDYFYTYQTSVASITSLFTAYQEVIDSIYLFTPDQTNRANLANNAYGSLSDEFYGKQGALEKTRMDKHAHITANKQEQKNKIQTILDQAKQAIGGCQITGDLNFYSQLQGVGGQGLGNKGFYQKYREVNAQEAMIGNEVNYDLEKAEPVSLNAMSMLEAFNQAATSLRNEVYVNEFALSKFNYRTYGMEKDASGQSRKSNELIDPGNHMLLNQEVEYLLYGFSSCGANMSSAYAEMFSFRMAIRTLEALLDPKKELLNLGSPLLVLLTAAAEGSMKAFQDMNKLIKGEAVELSAKITTAALSLTYKDYLRIFLLLHSNNTKLLARMQALIELQTGKDLVLETTYIQGNATSDVRLWFIPQMMKVIEGTGLLGCKVYGNRCQLKSTAAYAY